MYQQQNHPIDDLLREHIHGVPTKTQKTKTTKKLKQKMSKNKYGYSYKDSGEYILT